MHFIVRNDLGRSTRPDGTLSDVALLAEIGRDLRSVYEDLLKEPLPEDLAAIVRELKTGDRGNGRPPTVAHEESGSTPLVT